MKVFNILILLLFTGCAASQHIPKSLRGEWRLEPSVDRDQYVTQFITNFPPETREGMAWAAVGFYKDMMKPILISKRSVFIEGENDEQFDLMTNFNAIISCSPPSIQFPDDDLAFQLDPDGRLMLVTSSSTNFYYRKKANKELKGISK